MKTLSRGARLCESIIRASRAGKGGTRNCGRPYLARRLDCTVRTVSRYVRELREAGRLEVTPPARVRTSGGWRSRGVNTFVLTCRHDPAPHVHGRLRRSRRDDTHVTPSPYGDRGGRRSRGRHRVSAAATAAHNADVEELLRLQAEHLAKNGAA